MTILDYIIKYDLDTSMACYIGSGKCWTYYNKLSEFLLDSSMFHLKDSNRKVRCINKVLRPHACYLEICLVHELY